MKNKKPSKDHNEKRENLIEGDGERKSRLGGVKFLPKMSEGNSMLKHLPNLV
jgi:hypothetical protein